MESAGSSETLIAFYRTVWRHIHYTDDCDHKYSFLRQHEISRSTSDMQWLTKQFYCGFHGERHVMVFRVLTPSDSISLFNKPIVICGVRIQMTSFGIFSFLSLSLELWKLKELWRGPGSSVGIATDYCWTVRDRIPVGTRFSARPDRLWGPPSLL